VLKILEGTSWWKIRTKSGGTQYRTNIVWPYSAMYYEYFGEFWELLRENIDGSRPVFPLIILCENPDKNIMGELQGCFAVPGFGGIAAEDTFTINGDTYIAFPIVPNADASDFWCMKKE
jgi:hypothetical protein